MTTTHLDLFGRPLPLGAQTKMPFLREDELARQAERAAASHWARREVVAATGQLFVENDREEE
jgi:hypothetical protein